MAGARTTPSIWFLQMVMGTKSISAPFEFAHHVAVHTHISGMCRMHADKTFNPSESQKKVSF